MHISLVLAEGKAQARPWTCHDAELALWAFHYAKKFDVEVVGAQTTAPGDEGGGEESRQPAGDKEELKPETKRMKLDTSVG